MDTEDLLSMLKKLAEGQKMEEFTSRTEAETELKNFLEAQKNNPFSVGDMVDRNEMGLQRYKFPKANQVAIVVKKLAEPDYEDGELDDMVIAVAIAKGVFRCYPVSSAYYQKATAKGNTTYNFKKPDASKFDA